MFASRVSHERSIYVLFVYVSICVRLTDFQPADYLLWPKNHLSPWGNLISYDSNWYSHKQHEWVSSLFVREYLKSVQLLRVGAVEPSNWWMDGTLVVRGSSSNNNGIAISSAANCKCNKHLGNKKHGETNRINWEQITLSHCVCHNSVTTELNCNTDRPR